MCCKSTLTVNCKVGIDTERCSLFFSAVSACFPLLTLQLHMQYASLGMMHDSGAVSIESVVNHSVLIAMLSAGCKMLTVIWYMRVMSMLVRAYVYRMMHSARKSWTRCCCTAPACSESYASHQPMVASLIRYITSIMQVCGSKSCLKTMLLLLHLLSCSCCCTAWAGHDTWPISISYLGIVVQEVSVPIVM